MNRLKSKQNLNPIQSKLQKKEIIHDTKVQIRNKSLIVQNPNNPQKLNNTKKSLDKGLLIKKKFNVKKEYLRPQQHYQEQIIDYIFQQSKNTLKKFKSKTQFTGYKDFRTLLLQFTYRKSRKLQLKKQTFFLAAHYIDTYVKSQGNRKIPNQEMAFCSYATFLMAQKYEQIYPPSIQEWLQSKYHQQTYKTQGKVLFGLDFKLIYQSVQTYFNYWCTKFELKLFEKQNCQTVLDSIVFNYDLLYKYQPQKIAKCVVLMQIGLNISKYTDQFIRQGFNSQNQRYKIINDITKHISQNKDRLYWIQSIM